ncbi:Predicted ATPase [Agrococcus baldri]|uniref:Predicted ATPase n=1 Tax=Agrococcus baldri TaxID=153730 RepID=A0AA94HMU3_9MICO|nr:Predicted ATPase [Agrococcus baldri]
MIRTPDQRVRVFVSSTLRELADERRAVRAAIERLRLAPVMFELGARPHPPRSLYRSYLAQSDVFLGIYGDSYGWVAAGEELSGLEDEYRLAPPEMPKLIYIRASEQREPRLEALIERIQQDDTAAYLPFGSAAELQEQVISDLATLLAERFDESRPTPSHASGGADEIPPTPDLRLPVPYTSTIGRERELGEVRELLAAGSDRVISLIGPGGIGKSRLAVEIARATEDLFPDGRYFLPLEGVFEPGLLLPTIAYVLGIRDNGEAVLEERVARALEGRRVLLVLDNFEQIIDAAPLLVRLFSLAPSATFLVTSRVVLRIRGERVYDVQALGVPDAARGRAGAARAERSAACRLFVDRARAVNPGFALTDENAAAIADICRRLEGLPLAIELVAAKARMLTPQGIAERLEQSLPMLTAAARDLPDRHQTMRATIDWSVSLLGDEDRGLLEDLGVFARQFTLEAVEALGAGRAWEGRAMEGVAALVDASLVKQAQLGGRSVLSLLAVVREHSLGRLKERGEAGRMRAAHADHYSALVARVAPGLRGPGQAESVVQLGLELPNLRAAVRHLVHIDRLDDAGDFAWRLLVYWWIAGFFGEVRVWMLELLDKEQPITPHTRAVAWFFALWSEMWQRPTEQVVAGLGECVRLFTESGDEDAAAMSVAARATARLQLPLPELDAAERELGEAVERLRALENRWAEAITEVSRGRLAWLRGKQDEAQSHFDRATEVAEASGDLFTLSVAGNHQARLQLVRGEVDAAESGCIRTLLVSTRLHFEEGVAYGLEGLCAVAAARGDAERAGTLAAAADTIRQRIGVFDAEVFTVHTPQLDGIRAADPRAVAAGELRGAELTVPEAIALALPAPELERIAASLVGW